MDGGSSINLLDNAVKYTDQGGKIKIDVNQGQFYTKINISDTGRGIAAEHLNKIFQRFYREPEAEGEEGIGLGPASRKGNYLNWRKGISVWLRLWGRGRHFLSIF